MLRSAVRWPNGDTCGATCYHRFFRTSQTKAWYNNTMEHNDFVDDHVDLDKLMPITNEVTTLGLNVVNIGKRLSKALEQHCLHETSSLREQSYYEGLFDGYELVIENTNALVTVDTLFTMAYNFKEFARWAKDEIEEPNPWNGKLDLLAMLEAFNVERKRFADCVGFDG